MTAASEVGLRTTFGNLGSTLARRAALAQAGRDQAEAKATADR